MNFFSVLDDEKWLAEAPAAPLKDLEFERRLDRAHDRLKAEMRTPESNETEISGSTSMAVHESAETGARRNGARWARENLFLAQQTLAQYGLVVKQEPTALSLETSSPSTASMMSTVSIAHYIANTLLNFSLINNKPCSHSFKLTLGPALPPTFIQIPPRSRLLLRHLSRRLGIRIFLFSSRSKSRQYGEDTSKPSIGFLHHVDSFHGTGEYLVLAASRNQPSTHMILDTFQKFHSTTPPAVIRFGARRPTRGTKRTFDQVSEAECQAYFKRAWYVAIIHVSKVRHMYRPLILFS